MEPQEIDRELVALIEERSTLVRRVERGESGLQPDIKNVTDCINYTQGAWRRYQWPRYFRTYGSATLHTDSLCRGIKRSRPQLVLALSGVSDLDVVASHGKLCRHCLRA